MNFPLLSIVEVPGKAAGKFLKEKNNEHPSPFK
jgi:hypothetical protein